MSNSVTKLVKISDKTRVTTPVEVNGRKYYFDLRTIGYEYLLGIYRDGSTGLYLTTPDGYIDKDDISVIESEGLSTDLEMLNAHTASPKTSVATRNEYGTGRHMPEEGVMHV